jgi:hypothetical protein
VSCYAVKYCFVVKLSMLCMQEACRGGRRAVACRAAAQASTLVVGLVAPPPWRRWTEHSASMVVAENACTWLLTPWCSLTQWLLLSRTHAHELLVCAQSFE